MAIRKITEYPETVLGEMGQPVTEFDEKLAALCDDMFDTMYDAEGVGLAAPQIGLSLPPFCNGLRGSQACCREPRDRRYRRRAVKPGGMPFDRQGAGGGRATGAGYASRRKI